MKHFIRFYTLACLLSWLIWLPLYLPKLGISLPFDVPFNHALGGLGPLLAAFLLIAKERGKPGLRTLLQRMVAWRPVFYLLLAVSSPFLLLFAAGGIQYGVTGNFLSLEAVGISPEFPRFSLISFFVFNLVFFGFGEEVGWAGYAVPALQKRYSPLTVAMLFTLFWAAWHLPLFFYRPGYVSMGAAGIAGWLFSLFTGRILLVWLQNASKGSILIPALFHTAIDVAFTSKATTADLTGYLGLLITVWGLATVFFLKKQKPSGSGRLLPKKKAELAT